MTYEDHGRPGLESIFVVVKSAELMFYIYVQHLAPLMTHLSFGLFLR